MDKADEETLRQVFHGPGSPPMVPELLGWGFLTLLPDRPSQAEFKKLFDQGKVVAAICHAGSVLVAADELKGKRATSYFAIKDDMKNAGADWVDEEVVVDGGLITSRCPDDLPAFCRAIIGALS